MDGGTRARGNVQPMVILGATFTRRTPSPAQSCQPVASPIPLLAKCSSRTDIPHRLLFSCTAFFHPSSCVHSMPHVIPLLISPPPHFFSLVLRFVFSSPFAFCLYLSSQIWARGCGLQALVLDSSLVWGRSNASMIGP
jgi:hypothetical protein